MSNANEPPGKQRDDDVWLGPDIGWASRQCVESMIVWGDLPPQSTAPNPGVPERRPRTKRHWWNRNRRPA